MRRGMLVVVSFAVALSCLATSAFAAPTTGAGARGDALDIGALSDRFDSLNKLGNSLTDEEDVVIATRVGVLVSTNRALNDSAVSFDGEVVGDVTTAGEGFKWANIRGQSNSVISVYLPDEQASLIRNVGNYGMSGTSLKVTGVYHIACPVHQGELDVHATSAEVTDNGGPITHTISAGKFRAGIVLCVLAGIVLGAYLLARRFFQNRGEA